MNRNTLLIVIAVALVGILGFMVINYQEKSQSPGEKISSGLSEATEEIKDEIDDHTTSK